MKKIILLLAAFSFILISMHAIQAAECSCPENGDCVISASCTVPDGTVWNLNSLEIKQGATITVNFSDKSGNYCKKGGAGGQGWMSGEWKDSGGKGGNGGCLGSAGQKGSVSVRKSSDEHYCENKRSPTTNEGKGGRGGGKFIIIAETITLDGNIDANGEDGGDGCPGDGVGNGWNDWAAGGQGAGGGGGGGTVTVITSILKGEHGIIFAIGGSGGDGGNGGGDGGENPGEDGGGGGGGAGGNGGIINITIKYKDESSILQENVIPQHFLVNNGSAGAGGGKRANSKKGSDGNYGEKGSLNIDKQFCMVGTTQYVNLETWCVYDLNPYEPGSEYNLSNGNDAVGSRHWLFQCQSGDIKPVSLGNSDAREKICYQNDFKSNKYNSCLQKTSKADCESLEFDGNDWCRWLEDRCVPKYPAGYLDWNCNEGSGIFDTGLKAVKKDNTTITIGTAECEYTDYFTDLEKCLMGAAMDSKGAEITGWIESMERKCTAIGDCGSRINFNTKVQHNPGNITIAFIPQPDENLIIEFECVPVEKIPPTTSSGICESCNDPLKNCSEYRCASLGSNCIFDKNSLNCSSDRTTGAIPPEISNLNANICTTSETNDGYEIKCPGDSCIPPYSNLVIRYVTDDNAICRWLAFPEGESATSNWDEMLYADNNPNNYSKTHTYNMPSNMIPLSPLAYLEKSFNVTMILKCKGSLGKEKTTEISFCLSATDATDPEIDTSLKDGGHVPDDFNATVYVNEPVKECRWKISADNIEPDYEEMTNTISGGSFKPSAERMGQREANASFKLATSEETNYLHIQCKDLGGLKGEYGIELSPISEDLRIDVYPESGSTINECGVNGKVLVTLNATTSGDIGDGEGKATCYYKEGAAWTEFDETGERSEHSQKLNLSEGSYTYEIRCKDDYGYNTFAYNKTTFAVKIGTTGITRIYKESGLVIKTDKTATCKYGDNCGFDMKWSGTEMLSSDGIIHTTEWSDTPWFIKCADKCGNTVCFKITPLDFD